MTQFLVPRVTIVWAVLFGVALVSLWLGTGHGIADARVAGVVLMVLAFVKVRLIGSNFMDLRTAPPVLRRLFDGWVVVVGAGVIALFLIG